jgi:hypothetical protein
MNSLSNIPKEIIIYSTVAVAGVVFIFKTFFGRKKVNKKFYDKNKKKICARAKLFFNDLSKKVEAKQIVKNSDKIDSQIADKYYKMKVFVQKVADNIENTITVEKDEKKCANAPPASKKDQIFYLLLNNVSNMMIQQQQNQKVKQ